MVERDEVENLDADSSPPRPFLGRRGDLIRVELEVDTEALDGSPFVCLDEFGNTSRVLLARLVCPNRTTIRRFALKIQRDAYDPSVNELTNREIDETWRREAQGLACAAGPGVVETLPFPLPTKSLPIFYCRTKDRYFHPPCPATAEPMAVCENERLLDQSGLKSFAETQIRYLHGRTRAQDSHAFYKLQAGNAQENPTGGVRLREGAAALYEDWSELATGEIEDSEVEARARAGFPCRTCDRRSTCFASPPEGKTIEAAKHLYPLSFYDFHYLPLELLELRYEELVQLIGGADWRSILLEACDAGRRGRERILEPLEARFSRSRQWLLSHDQTGRYAMEVFRLKLAAFRGVCEGLHRLHAECGRPHFDLQPDNLMATLAKTRVAAPERWQFEVKLIDLGSPVSRRHPKPLDRDAPTLLGPGPGHDRNHLSPLVSKAEPFNARVVLEVLSRDESGDTVSLEFTVQSRDLRADHFVPGDSARIETGSPERRWIWATILATEDRQYRLGARLERTHPCRDWQPQHRADATLHLFPDFKAPCDLYGLGMVLLRTLLVNDEQNGHEVCEAVRRASQGLDVELDRIPHWSPQHCRDELLKTFRRTDRVFGRASIFHVEELRNLPVNRFDQTLWNDVLIFAFRMITARKGFSFVSTHGGERQPGDSLKLVLAELERFERRLEIDLFAHDLRDAELHSLCDTALTKLRDEQLARQAATHGPAPSTGPTPPPAPGEQPAAEDLQATMIRPSSAPTPPPSAS